MEWMFAYLDNKMFFGNMLNQWFKNEIYSAKWLFV